MAESRNIIIIYTLTTYCMLYKEDFDNSGSSAEGTLVSASLQVIEKESTAAGQRSETERGPERLCKGRKSPV